MDHDARKRTSASAAPLPLLPPAPAAPQPLLPPASAAPQPLHPKVLILSSEERRLASLSPFQRREGCDKLGKVARCDKLRDGGLEVEFVREEDARRALMTKEFSFTVREHGTKQVVSLAMSVSPHRTKNTSRGIINCFDLRETTDEEIVDGLAPFGVIAAHKLKTRNKSGQVVNTNNIVLTFNSVSLPSEVIVGYIRVKVRTFIPNPMRCFRCQRFGHTRTHCHGRPTCSKCASTEHIEDDCDSETYRCVNCGEGQSPHTSFDKSCPAYAKEKEIISIKANRNISFREAREVYNETHPTISYARKVTSSVTSKPAMLEQMSAPQLVELLKSFGLAVVAAGAGGAVLSGPTNPAAPAAPAVPAAAAPMPPSDVEPEEGWTLVQRRRVAGQRSPSPARAAPASAQAPDHHRIVVQEALRRGEAERKAREAKRARLAEKAREGKRSPGADSISATSSRGASVTPETPQPGSPSRMPPPPPPPPLPQRRPPPLMTPATPVSRPQQAASKQSQLPSGPDRPVKRAPPWKGSPTERGNPRSRLKLQASSGAARSVSADGRPHQEGSGHPRILYGESPSSGAEELV